MVMSEDKLNLSKIKQLPLHHSQYVNENTKKLQIVLHHTAGNSSAPATIKMWDKDDRGRIATCIVISGKGLSKDTFDGEICQAFSSRNWAYHLGIKPDVFRAMGVPYQRLDKMTIGIEICNWGPLKLKDGKYYNYVNREVPLDQVCELPKAYKGYKYYHAYTDAQIESVRQLLVYWNKIYGISLTYNESDMWSVSKNALSGVAGVYTHNSYRRDKSDISPQPKMIEMLTTL
jgi:N-acetyl-anhydromuramyl-L-alanine amidase AmpD